MNGGPLASVGRVLDLVRAWAPVYQRWWRHAHRRGAGGVEPWTATDEELWAWAGGLDVQRIAAVAGELRRASTELTAHQAGIARVIASGGVPEAAVPRCLSLAASAEARAGDAAHLADALDHAAADLGDLWEGLADRVRLAEADLVDGGSYPSPEAALRDIDAAEQVPSWPPPQPDRWRLLDNLIHRHGSVLTALREGLAEVADRFGRERGAGLDAWRDGSNGWLQAASPLPLPPPTEPAPEPRSDGPVADAGAWVSERWQPLTAAPGNGPLLPGTEGTRPGTDTGVRIAELPDRPPA